MSHDFTSSGEKSEAFSIAVAHRTYIRATPEALYARLTSGQGWERWFATSASIGSRPGEPIYFRWQSYGADRYSAEDRGRVVSLEEAHHFAFTWHPGNTETLVSLRFESRGDGCILSVKETGYSESIFDRDIALQVASGWGEALTLLKFFVEYDLTYGLVPDND